MKKWSDTALDLTKHVTSSEFHSVFGGTNASIDAWMGRLGIEKVIRFLRLIQELEGVYDLSDKNERENILKRAKERWAERRKEGGFIVGRLLVYLDGEEIPYNDHYVEDYLEFKAAGFDTKFYNGIIRITPFPLPFGED